MKSIYTVINTVTGPEDYIAYLQPSEEATAWQNTNTYYSRLIIMRTLHDQIASKRIVSDESILTQVVITESLPGQGTPLAPMNMEHGYLHIYATRSTMETITFLAKPSMSTDMDAIEEMQTEVVKRVITDVVPNSRLQPELLSTLQTQLMLENESHSRKVVTVATLLEGQILQVTALSLFTNSSNGFGKKSDYPQITSNIVDSESSIKKTRNQNESGIDFYDEPVYESEDNGLNMSESQHQYVYRKPPTFDAISKTPSVSTVENIFGALNLEKFRPVFNVMADLLQKNVNPSMKQKLNELGKNNLTVNERPTYIPIKLTGDLKKMMIPIAGNMTIDPKLNRLTAQNLHISPPQVHNLEEHNILFSIHKHHTPISHGIPIRPGEIINANADVIIGRPNGIIQQLVYPLKKTWPAQPTSTFHSHFLSNTLVPPLPFGAANFQRVHPDYYATINMLRPPAPSFFHSPTSNLYLNRPSQEITNLNAELNSNEIIEIRPIPQIFSTQMPIVTQITYAKVDNTAFANILPSAHHRISLKTDVLSHDVAVNVPPLTFKQENDNFPAATAVSGHISLPTVPLVKIPADKTQLGVRLTPNSNRLDVASISIEKEQKSEAKRISTFKQRNQNLLKHDRLNIPVSNKIAFSTSNTWKTVRPKTEPLNKNDSMHMSSQKYYNLILLKPFTKLQQKQSFDKVNNFQANSSLPHLNLTFNLSLNSFELDMFSLSSTRPANKSFTFGQPFITQKQSFDSGNSKTPVKSDLHKKLYLATGEPFNLNSAGHDEAFFKFLRSAGPLSTVKSRVIAKEVQTRHPELFLESEGKLQLPRIFSPVLITNVSVLDVSSTSNYYNKTINFPKPSISKIALKLSSSSSVIYLYESRTVSMLSATSLSQERSTVSFSTQKQPTFSSNVTLPMNIKHSTNFFPAESSVINTKPIFQFGTSSTKQIVTNNKSEINSMPPYMVASLIPTEKLKSSIKTYITSSIQPNPTLSIPVETLEILSKNNDSLGRSSIFGISKLIFSSESDNSIKEIVKTDTDSSLIRQSVVKVNTSRIETNTRILFSKLNSKSFKKIDTILPNISKYSVIMTKAPGNDIINNYKMFDFDDYTSFELPTRDEEFVPPLNSNSVALGGVLIATSSKSQNVRSQSEDLVCNPSCKSKKNEICSYNADFGSSCECRLGFARMFPDRPCKRKYR